MTRDERRGGLIDGTKLAREHAAMKEARAQRRHAIRSHLAGVLFGVAFALAVASLVADDGLPWLAGAFMLAIVGAFTYPEGGA